MLYYLSDESLSALVYHIDIMTEGCRFVSSMEAIRILHDRLCIDDDGELRHNRLLHKLGAFHIRPIEYLEGQVTQAPWALIRPQERPTAQQIIKLCDYYLNIVDAGSIKGPAAPAIREVIEAAPEYRLIKWLMATTAIEFVSRTQAYKDAGWGVVTQFEHPAKSHDAADIFTIL